MEQGRHDLQLGQFRKALLALQDAITTDDGDKKSRDSILLSYVFSFEMAWKSLRSSLALRGLKSDDYAAAVLRAGLQAGVIDAPDIWDKLRTCRNDVSHAYDEQQAIAIAAFVREIAARQLSELLIRLGRND